MATSVLMAAADHQTTNPNTPLPFPQNHYDHDINLNHTIRRSSGRRKPKGCDTSSSELKKKNNKTPQRGMGVEKLERLRLQERWKKMTEINTNNIPAVSFSDPISKLGGFGAPNVGQMGLNLGFHGQMGHVGGLMVSDQLQTDLFGNGCLNNPVFVGNKNVSGISKLELSSNPNVVKCYSQHCNACHKKKKANGENLGSGRVRSDMYNVGDCGFLGLNIGEYQNIISQENQGLNIGTKAVGNGKQGVELVAVHRKGSSSSDGVMMEYEFFPSGKGFCRSSDDNSQNDELVMMNNSENCLSSPMQLGFDDINGSSCSCVDLSLKLSYY